MGIFWSSTETQKASQKDLTPEEFENLVWRPGAGPFGYGDPDDPVITPDEDKNIIADRMRKKVTQGPCYEKWRQYGDCCKTNPRSYFWLCGSEVEIMNNCFIKYYKDPEFVQQITKEYLEDRAQYRRTGKEPHQIRLDKYREWKKEHPDVA